MERVRREIRLRGVIQGIGFRPWAARQAVAFGLGGHVRNTPEGVHLALEGAPAAVEAWLRALAEQPPAGARIEGITQASLPCRGERTFGIKASRMPAVPTDRSAGAAAGGRAHGSRIPPDAPLCAGCLEDLFTPGDRRYRYPFAHCAACGPRAAVLLDLPYDRDRTTLRVFRPCRDCQREYDDPADRRFHAQTIACAGCGPRLRALDAGGRLLAGDPVETAAAAIRTGGIVAVKGYGGFHLVCDATFAEAVARLRKRKARPAKPLAVMVPEIGTARDLCDLDPPSEALLAGPLRGVVVAPRREAGAVALGLVPAIAPRTTDLGVLLPYAPVHWLLFFAPRTRPGRDAPRFRALVFTSGNLSGEPTVHGNRAAREKLGGVADLFLEHDRDVARPNDDPVFRSAPGRAIPMRLSRATAPLPLPLPPSLRDTPPLLALGGDLKCAPAVLAGGEVVLAEHVGDLASPDALDRLRRLSAGLARTLGVVPRAVAHDLHPGYLGTALARDLGLRRIAVQHHHAHALACLLDNAVEGPALALVLDGAGYGDDGTIWGGELLLVDGPRFARLAHLEQVPLPGGDAAARSPWRMAAVWLDRAFAGGWPSIPWRERQSDRDLHNLARISRRGAASPPTSSCGRLFDAVASLLDLGDRASYEGEAATALESLAARAAGARRPAPLPAASAGGTVIPARDLIRGLVEARRRGEDRAAIAWWFHEALAARLAHAVAAAAARTGLRQIALSGGCFQNRILLEGLRRRLGTAGLTVLTHARIPPNDGGLAVGQAVAAAARLLEAGKGDG